MLARRLAVSMALLAVVPSVGWAASSNNPNGSVFRAVGWFKGKAEIAAGRINCEIPNVTNAISEGLFSVGVWNTYGQPTIFYPDPNNPYANPCGGWLQLQNNLIDQAIVIDHIDLHYMIRNARGFLATVATQRRFPYACKTLRHDARFLGARLNPSNSTQETSSSGAPNVAFIQMLPLVSPELISCLRAVYAPFLNGASNTLQLVVNATARGTSDSGSRYTSNTTRYTLSLRHSCGNGRVDDGEACDSAAPNTCIGVCTGGHCSQSDQIPCAVDADCAGVCIAPDDPSECTCVY